MIAHESKDLKDIIARLNERLHEPFVTAGTVTSDKCIFAKVINPTDKLTKELKELGII